MDKMREDFEAWASDNGSHPRAVHRGANGGYQLMSTHAAWEAWQASRKALVVTVPDKVMEEDEFDKGHNCAIDYCAEAIREARITVKGEGDAS